MRHRSKQLLFENGMPFLISESSIDQELTMVLLYLSIVSLVGSLAINLFASDMSDFLWQFLLLFGVASLIFSMFNYRLASKRKKAGLQ